MRLLTRTISSDWDDGDCQYAVIEIDQKTKEMILKKRELFQTVKAKNEDLISITFQDQSANYYSTYGGFEFLGDMTEDVIIDKICYGMVLQLDTDQELPKNNIQRVVVERLVLEDDVFYWECFPKHSSITIQTEGIAFEELS